MPREPTAPGGDDLPAAKRRSALLAGVVIALVLGMLLSLAFIPRTVAEGGRGDATWRLRVAPGVVSPSIRLDDPQDVVALDVAPIATMDQTAVWQRPSGDAVDTIVVGPTPRGVRSVRLTSESGVGEASIERVRWRRVHVWVADEPATVTDLASIGRDGQVMDVVPVVRSGTAG